MSAVESPAPAHLDDAIELAEILRPFWPEMQAEVRRTAAFLNDGEEIEEGGEGQPSPEAEHSPEGNQQGDEDHESSFLDDYDLGEIDDPQAREVAERTVKRLNAAYTKRRQQEAEELRNAREAQAIIEGLLDRDRRSEVAQALGLQLAEPEPEDYPEFDDPNERIDALQAELAHRDQVAEAIQRQQEENQYVTEGIEKLEDDLHLDEIGMPFDDDEIHGLYLLADEFRDAQGKPDVRAAYKVLDSLAASHYRRMAEIRKRAPRVPGKGSPADRKVDLSNEDDRIDAGVRAAQRLLAERTSTT